MAVAVPCLCPYEEQPPSTLPAVLGGAARPDNVHLDEAELALEALKGTSTLPDECAEGVEHKPGTPCASKRVLALITDFVEEAKKEGAHKITREKALGQALEAFANSTTLPTSADGAPVREAAALLGCSSESCVLAHPAVHEFVEQQKQVPAAALDAELEVRFKAAGPRDSLALLSNFNIDETLQRWARAFSFFFPCPFAMMDFDRNGDLFGAIDLVDVLEGRIPVNLGTARVMRKSTCFGCVLNTDSSSGPGKHWVAVFVDCREPADGKAWTVEYFNSAGRPPPKVVVGWMARTRAALAEHRNGSSGVECVPVTDVGHQESQTECGLYAMYYIRCRLEGIPTDFFFRHLIPDAAMTAFRKHVFRSGK
jgi:hypothetical protein